MHGNPAVPSVNSFVESDSFPTTWDDYNVVASFIRSQPGDLKLALFNWAKAYRQIPTAKNQWPYLMIKYFQGDVLIDTQITFGGVAGCGSFGRLAEAWKKIMLNKFDLVQVFRWVDDNLFVKLSTSSTSMEDIVARSNKLGVKTNEGKFTTFSDKQKFIGFVWNAKQKIVRLPDGKLFDRVLQVKDFLAKEKCTFKEVKVMVGRLNHVSYILPQL
jgi:hypothetical protein